MTTEDGASSRLGYKAEKLYELPTAWVPPFFTIDADKLSSQNSSDLGSYIADESERLGFKSIIIRSSGIGENLDQRGRFSSYEVLDLSDKQKIASAIDQISNEGITNQLEMALIVQALINVKSKGHFSNERRVSATRNHWEIEVEHPHYEQSRTNSQRDTPPPIDRPLRVASANTLSRLFAQIGHWINQNFLGRAHLEWVIDGQFLWIVQLDLEDDAPDIGIDPRKVTDFVPHVLSSCIKTAPLHLWSDYKDTEFRKVSTIASFANVTSGKYPKLYVLNAGDALILLNTYTLTEKISTVVGTRVVGRTDVRPSARGRTQGLNLPRTDTCNPDQITAFVRKTLEEWKSSGLNLTDAIFLFHEYLPAICGAWAEASPGSRVVQIDALWGLPDGLQYLDHDSFEFDLPIDQIISEHTRYKSWFIAEMPDGSWQRKQVRRDLTRHSSIPREHVVEIAQATYKLALEVNARLRVMWFVGVHKEGIAPLFPWFSHKPEVDQDAVLNTELQDQSSLRSYPPYSIREPADLTGIPVGRWRLHLDPQAEFMRNNALLEKIAEAAKIGGHSVEIRGSGLCHAFYLLTSLGVPVVAPFTRRYTRVRKRQSFGKLVRDRIPERIQSRGERVRWVTIPLLERRRALASKLIEEAQEVATSSNSQDIASELADVLEIVKAIAELEDVSWSEIEARADEKREKSGSFKEAKLLIETNVPSARPKREFRRSLRYDPHAIRKLESGLVIPYISLIEDGVEFELKGRAFSIRLRPEGVILEQLKDRGQLPQLNLPLGDL